MCGVGDAITTGTNADTGTNPDREHIAKIAARPRRPYHAFVSSCSQCFAALFHFSRVDSFDGNTTFCHDVLLHIGLCIVAINTFSEAPQRTEFDENTAIHSHEFPANRPGDVHHTRWCGDNGRAYDVMALTLPKTIDVLPSATVAFCFTRRTPA